MAPKKRAASQTNKSRKVQNQHKISFSEKRRIFSTKGLAKLQRSTLTMNTKSPKK